MKHDRGGKPVVLVVDDDPDMLNLMESRLKSEGFAVQLSQNGESIVDIITQTPPNVVLLDIHMDGVDGGTICQLIKTSKSTSNLPVILFSANDDIEAIAIKCGADGFIPKPFNSAKFRDTFRKIPGIGVA